MFFVYHRKLQLYLLVFQVCSTSGSEIPFCAACQSKKSNKYLIAFGSGFPLGTVNTTLNRSSTKGCKILCILIESSNMDQIDKPNIQTFVANNLGKNTSRINFCLPPPAPACSTLLSSGFTCNSNKELEYTFVEARKQEEVQTNVPQFLCD